MTWHDFSPLPLRNHGSSLVVVVASKQRQQFEAVVWTSGVARGSGSCSKVTNCKRGGVRFPGVGGGGVGLGHKELWLHAQLGSLNGSAHHRCS